MEDLNERLASILNDPKSMERVRQMAESLLGDEPQNREEPKTDLSALSSLFSGGENMPDPQTLGKIMSIMGRLNSKNDDCRTALLTALKPNLSEERRKKVDTAIKILKFIELLPLLKESGILNL